MLFSGLGLGVLAALLFAYSLRPQLWGVTWTDPATYAGACFILVFAAAAACLAPTRRAVLVDPTTILRVE